MINERLARGATLLCDSADDVPLVWLDVAIPGGAAADPDGLEGFTHHAALLARNGAGARDRARIDADLDSLGAAVDVSVERDAVIYSVVALRRNLDRVVDILADILAAPRFEPGEHDKLLRETRHGLDDLREDDAALAGRFFNRYYAPGHPYARSVTGTEASLAALGAEAARAGHRAMVVPESLVIGLAGAIDGPGARAIAERLIAGLPDAEAPPLPAVDTGEHADRRRLYLVDKPERSQSQLRIGHLAPRYGTPDFTALVYVETIFGGTFTSRLMQEIRAKRGWSYGAGCSLRRTRGRHWFRIHLSPSAETTPEALALTFELFETLVAHGVTDEEMTFARDYLLGSYPFHRTTPHQRLRLAMRDALMGLPATHADDYVKRVESVDRAAVERAIARWLRPDSAVTVLVASAEQMAPRLEGLAGELEIVRYDSY